ncbi:hypothetical protein JC965_24415 [Aeromonas caviae]|uniref:Uncharacterized protein n=1 Tax=Aeromonas caviae TaxID=648 RepID=A0A7T3X2B7_AERCA|nr:hypothetical protein [Aeromonas caviae]QQA60872.1 hypothetical protein JC965_24240 [Aeromonas caviae]QQA60895.1 hypothetical protein JC965_24415 [Aeromonas caviae]
MKQQLSQTPGETLMLAGLRINLHRLHPQFQQLSEAELKEQIRDTDRHIASLEVQQQTAEQRHQAEAHKQRLEQEQQQLRQELADFDTWQHLLAQSDQRAEQLIAHEQELDRLQAELAAINQQQLSLVDQLNALRQAQMRLDDEHNGIVTMRNQREDQGPEFGYLESLSYHPWLGEPPERWIPYIPVCKNSRPIVVNCWR